MEFLEILKSANLSEESIVEIQKQMTEKNVRILTDEENYIPKTRFEQVNNEKKQYKKDLEDTKQQLEELSKNNKNEELSNTIKELTDKLTTSELNTKNIMINSNIKEYALRNKIKENAYDLLDKIINKDNIVINELGEIEGIDNIFNELKQNKSFLFDEEKVDITGKTPVDNNNDNNTKQLDPFISGLFGKL
jgi:hypothetical protein